jgi:transcriptional regulator with XRE-family HTH domain
MVAPKRQARAIATGVRIKQARLRIGMSQSQVARACSITEGAFRFIEQGRSEPRATTLRLLCQVLGTSADFILFGIQSRDAA